MLYELVKGNDIIRFSESFEDGEKLYAKMQEMGMEGIVSKRKDSIYRPGERSNNWLKTPTEKRQEFVIGGWVESDRGRPFASLLFGAYNNKKFEWIGHAGGGFKEKDMPVILKQMQKIEIEKSPFANKVDSNGIAHWIKPELVANFKFATWTKSGRIRKPAIFLGFRNDKKAKDVVREVPEEKSTVEKEIQDAANQKTPAAIPEKNRKTKIVSPKTKPASIKKKSASEDSHWPDVESQEITSEQEFDVHGCNILINNIDRKIWKEVTKFDLLQYYLLVADDMLPHLKNRPQSLHLKLVNAGAPGFYIKDMEGRQPACGDIFSVKRKHKKPGMRDCIDYLVCNNEATLLWMVNLGCIDINPWTSRTSNPDQPDYIIIDLDPSDDNFKKAVVTALAAKQYFDKLKIKAFVKTSGKTGIHLYLPCRGFNFKQARNLAEFICEEIHQLVPGITTTEVTISHRGDKLYLDPNQNDYADTVAAPYSVRPFHEPLVSTPLDWKEVKASLDQYDFNIATIGKRLHKKGDLFAAVNDEKIAAANSVILLKLLSR
jgi:bifunctional non-homologous end joining protein LigD